MQANSLHKLFHFHFEPGNCGKGKITKYWISEYLLDDIKSIFQFLQAIILWEIKKIKIADTSFKESTPTKNLQNFTKKLPFHAIQLVFWKLPYYFPIY